MTIDDDDDVSEDELREAQALAAALEGTRPPESLPRVPEDALQTAALLRHAGADGELSQERAQAVLDQVLATAPKARPRVVRFLPVAAGIALATAAAALLMLARGQHAAPASSASAPAPPGVIGERARALPAPPAALLAAQAELVRGDAAANARFAAQMRDYRGALLQSLERKYPAQVGWLEPARRDRSPR